MPGRNTTVSVSVTLTVGWDEAANSSGTPRQVEVGTWEAGPENPRPPTLEERGYALAAQTPTQDGTVLLYENPNIPGSPGGGVMLILVRPEQPPAPTGRIRNWQTTRIYALFSARQAAVDAIQTISLPQLSVRSNPAYGLTNLPSWFWVEVDQGQLDPGRVMSVAIPWETTWEEEVEVCEPGEVPGSDPPVIDPCLTRSAEWYGRRESGEITANIAIQLQASSAVWWFGDEQFEFYGREGIGIASYDVNQPSPVRHTYLVSSLGQAAQGGYEVRAFVAWQARYVVSLSNGQSESLTIPGARSNVFTARHEVREAQAILAQRPTD